MTARIHITGASGVGTTTLGAALAETFGCPHHDTDDFYWLPTEPPYREERDPAERLRLIETALRGAPAWVLSGSIGGWGEPLTALLDTVVFLTVPTELRIERLRARELREFGWDALAPGGAMHDEHEAFVEWAAHYDDGTRAGRSRPKHEAWLAQLPCPVIRLDGERPLGALVADVLEGIAAADAEG